MRANSSLARVAPSRTHYRAHARKMQFRRWRRERSSTLRETRYIHRHTCAYVLESVTIHPLFVARAGSAYAAAQDGNNIDRARARREYLGRTRGRAFTSSLLQYGGDRLRLLRE